MPEFNMRRMQLGTKAVISKITAQGEMGRRIRDMGLVPGASVEVIGKAPLRDPVALRVAGSAVARRNSEADDIAVRTED
ncbi:MAG: ferrous iron transport protein A [Mailhella sp.]|nr:ferrous iron transport protein A [Mailhella sp.]